MKKVIFLEQSNQRMVLGPFTLILEVPYGQPDEPVSCMAFDLQLNF